MQITVHEILAIIEFENERWEKLSSEIWNRPELAYHEEFACNTQTALLREMGFSVTSPYCGIETAYRAEYGNGTPIFAFAAEYDALPELGHGCGHNLICTAGVAAAFAVKQLMEKYSLPGKVVLLGTPAEESGGGKVKMLAQGCLDDINAVMMVHPSWRTVPDTGSTAIRRFNVDFTGKAAHAAGTPELGLNALDAVLLVFNAINAWRQQLPSQNLIHGIVTNGGEAPNIIPDHASCRFFLRSTDEKLIDKMEQRFFDIVHGAELMTGTTAEIQQFNIPYKGRKPNSEMNAMFMEKAKELGMYPIIPAKSGRGSSDFGDFSHTIPGIHPYFGIADHEIACHSIDFATAAATKYALGQALKGAAIMAFIGISFLTDEAFRKRVTASFENK